MSHDAPVIRTENLRKVYVAGEHSVVALDGISLTVRRGEFIAVMGPSGSGKSTFMNLIGCLDRPTAGAYWLDGVPTHTLSDRALARIRGRQIGFVFQGFNLLPRTTARANVELPLVYAGVSSDERRRRAVAALAMVGLETRVDHLPNQLSGGQQQRVAIARALVVEPTLILADEPTGNLDSRTSAEIMRLFRMLHQERGATIVLVTHEPDVAASAERTVSFHDGRIARDEPSNGRPGPSGTHALLLPRQPMVTPSRPGDTDDGR